MKIGVFGGTFNPIHYGHLRSAEEIMPIFGLERILFVPSGNPPLKKKDIAEAKHRLAMVRLAVRNNHGFEVVDIECVRPGISYSINTLEQLQRDYHGADLFFMLGIDAFLDIPNWLAPEKILALANVIVLSRPGRKFSELTHSPYLDIKKTQVSVLDKGEITLFSTVLRSGKKAVLTAVTPIGISSTEIRKCIKKGFSIKYLLPAEVESYIISKSLYRKII